MVESLKLSFGTKTTLSRLYLNRNLNVNSNDDDLANSNENGRIARHHGQITMKTYNNLYELIYRMNNLLLAWRKARKGKTKRRDVIEFEKNIEKNLVELHYEIKSKTYSPKPLTTFTLRDPKTRRISKADFRDRVVHHSLINIIGPIFEKLFIYDSCANQKDKGTLFAIKRFDKFMRKVSNNCKNLPNYLGDGNNIQGYCLKADIKHYFQNINHKVLLSIIKEKIIDKKVIWLIEKIVANSGSKREVNFEGMPLGNLTSQFFANVYLNELDYFVKHKLKVKHYIRYVDDFIILHESKEKLEKWKEEISKFLKEKLNLKLHQQKSRIISLARGVDFVGFRNFAHFKLLRKRNIRKMKKKIELFKKRKIYFGKLFDSYNGWQVYACWANSYSLRSEIKNKIINELLKQI